MNYLVILIVLIGHLFSSEENRKKSVLLFQINDEIESLEIINMDSKLINYQPFNKFLIDNNAYKVERWSEYSSEEDTYNGIRFSKIYRVYFINDSNFSISSIKNKLSELSYIHKVEYDYYRKLNY